MATQQDYVVGDQVNNQLQLTSSGKVRFAVLPDRSIKISAPSAANSSTSLTYARYAGEEKFTTFEGDIAVGKWTKIDEFQATHNLYFGFTKANSLKSNTPKTEPRSALNANQLVLEERISKDQFKRMFVISYSCELLTGPKKKLVANLVASSPDKLLENMSNRMGQESAPIKSFAPQFNPTPHRSIEDNTGAHPAVALSTPSRSKPTPGLSASAPAYSLNVNPESFSDKPIHFQCSGTSALKLLNKSPPAAPVPQPVTIYLTFDREEGRFEIPKGWDKFTENGVAAWIDLKEYSRNRKAEFAKKTVFYATLDSKTQDITTYLIFKMDTLRLHIKYEKISAAVTDIFEGVCTPNQ